MTPPPRGPVLRFSIDRLQTPIGQMLIVADLEGNLRATDWNDHDERMQRFLRIHYRIGLETERLELEPADNPGGLTQAIASYFAGNLHAIENLPVKTNGTEFQREVWRALRQIPAGATISYKTLAERIGRPAATRAVGLANGSNPVGVVVPCHRVIGADGSLTGYGGGMERKRWLLEHEGVRVNEQRMLQWPA